MTEEMNLMTELRPHFQAEGDWLAAAKAPMVLHQDQTSKMRTMSQVFHRNPSVFSSAACGKSPKPPAHGQHTTCLVSVAEDQTKPACEQLRSDMTLTKNTTAQNYLILLLPSQIADVVQRTQCVI